MIHPNLMRANRRPDRDYSRALRDLLPELIGPGKAPMSIREIAAASGRSVQTVAGLFKKIRAEIHIAGYRRGRASSPMALWAFGPGPDATPLPAMTAAEKSRRYRMTAHGQAANRAAAARWRATERGRQYQQGFYRNVVRPRRLKAKENAQMAYSLLQSIDPLMAAVMGSPRP